MMPTSWGRLLSRIPHVKNGVQLVEDNLALVDQIAGIIRRSGVPVPREDLIAAGRIGLLEAAERYDPQGGASFQTFAAKRVRGAIIDSFRVRGRPRPVETPLLDDPVAPDSRLAELVDSADWFSWICRDLTPRARAIVKLHFLMGFSFREIATMLGITEGRVSQIQANALAELRKTVA